MTYKKLKADKLTEEELRYIWKKHYCDKSNPIYTFDGILVSFYEDMFDHAFFESYNKRFGDKSLLSLNRLQKMMWIKDTLMDDNAILKKGWNKNKKSYSESRRLALIKDNYIVIIRIISKNKAKFLTAYEINIELNLQKIKNSPDWK